MNSAHFSCIDFRFEVMPCTPHTQNHKILSFEKADAGRDDLTNIKFPTFAVLPAVKPPGLRGDGAFSECLRLEGLNGRIESETITPETVPRGLSPRKERLRKT